MGNGYKTTDIQLIKLCLVSDEWFVYYSFQSGNRKTNNHSTTVDNQCEHCGQTDIQRDKWIFLPLNWTQTQPGLTNKKIEIKKKKKSFWHISEIRNYNWTYESFNSRIYTLIKKRADRPGLSGNIRLAVDFIARYVF